mmetsp:Transcript_26690/g.62657  ORF Transcript_26690/g.62657 Transcript_26690/m.62657 type:complete len:351 (+) Transcript_26690:669-1721(+)
MIRQAESPTFRARKKPSCVIEATIAVEAPVDVWSAISLALPNILDNSGTDKPSPPFSFSNCFTDFLISPASVLEYKGTPSSFRAPLTPSKTPNVRLVTNTASSPPQNTLEGCGRTLVDISILMGLGSATGVTIFSSFGFVSFSLTGWGRVVVAFCGFGATSTTSSSTTGAVDAAAVDRMSSKNPGAFSLGSVVVVVVVVVSSSVGPASLTDGATALKRSNKPGLFSFSTSFSGVSSTVSSSATGSETAPIHPPHPPPLPSSSDDSVVASSAGLSSVVSLVVSSPLLLNTLSNKVGSGSGSSSNRKSNHSPSCSFFFSLSFCRFCSASSSSRAVGASGNSSLASKSASVLM